MSIDEEYELLSQLELFENLDPVQLKRLIFVSQRYQLKAGEFLFRQGDSPGNVFGIIDGKFSVLLDSTGGQTQVAQHGSGELVGEMAVISGEPRNASIRADTDGEVIGFERELFLSTVTHDPQTALRMMKLLSERLSTLNKKLANQSDDDVQL